MSAPVTLELLEKLPPGEAVEAVDELGDWVDRDGEEVEIGHFLFGSRRPKFLDNLRGEAKDWAVRVASEPAADMSPVRQRLVMLSLVRAGIPIEPAWDAFLGTAHLEGDETAITTDLYVECALAIPEERRAKAVIASMKEHPVLAIDCGLAVLARWSSSELRDALAKMSSGRWSASKVKAKLAEMDGAPVEKRRSLRTGALRRPKARDLEATDEAQLRLARITPDGKPMKPGSTAPDDGEFEPLELRTLIDESGTHLYDAVMLGGDSGTIFEAGGTRIVATMVQSALKCEDTALAEALGEALREAAR